jgi:hypothetical protein
MGHIQQLPAALSLEPLDGGAAGGQLPRQAAGNLLAALEAALLLLTPAGDAAELVELQANQAKLLQVGLLQVGGRCRALRIRLRHLGPAASRVHGSSSISCLVVAKIDMPAQEQQAHAAAKQPRLGTCPTVPCLPHFAPPPLPPALQALLPLALEEGGAGHPAVRSRALRCLAGLAAGCPAGRAALAAATVRQQGAELQVLQVRLPPPPPLLPAPPCAAPPPPPPHPPAPAVAQGPAPSHAPPLGLPAGAQTHGTHLPHPTALRPCPLTPPPHTHTHHTYHTHAHYTHAHLHHTNHTPRRPRCARRCTRRSRLSGARPGWSSRPTAGATRRGRRCWRPPCWRGRAAATAAARRARSAPSWCWRSPAAAEATRRCRWGGVRRGQPPPAAAAS